MKMDEGCEGPEGMKGKLLPELLFARRNRRWWQRRQAQQGKDIMMPRFVCRVRIARMCKHLELDCRRAERARNETKRKEPDRRNGSGSEVRLDAKAVSKMSDESKALRGCSSTPWSQSVEHGEKGARLPRCDNEGNEGEAKVYVDV